MPSDAQRHGAERELRRQAAERRGRDHAGWDLTLGGTTFESEATGAFACRVIVPPVSHQR